jgi:hypothetical protein
VVLPAAVQEAADRLAKVEGELDALGGMPEVTSAESLMTGEGMALVKAQAEHRKQAEKAAKWTEARLIGQGEAAAARLNLNRVMAAHRDELILSIRPLVSALVEQARPEAETLARIHPNFAPGDIVHQGGPEHLLAFQAATVLERTFGLLVSAWRYSLREENYRSQGRVDVADVPQASLYWSNPGAVACDRLNGTRMNRFGQLTKIEPTLLLVASEPAEAGFRLASIPELIEVHAEFHATPIDREKARTLSVRAI